MRTFMLSLAIAAMAVPAASPAFADPGGKHGGWGKHGGHHDNGNHYGWRNGHGHGPWHGSRYDWNRPDPRYGYYDAVRYYHPGGYRERRLTRYDRIYRGSDGRYYCRRSDGTTGLIVGGVLGGLLGNAIANGHSATLATVLGASGGALIGRSIDRGNIRCR